MDRLRISRTVTSTATSAIGALVMVAALAFGASVVRPLTADRTSDATAAQQDGNGGTGGSQAGHGGDAPDYETPDKPADTGYEGVDGADDGDTPYHEPEDKPDQTDAPDAEATPKPEPDEPDPTDKPDGGDGGDEPDKPDAPDAMHLEAFVGEAGKIVVKWLPYEGDFDKYKVVRSTDSDPSWPMGSGDELVAVIGPWDETRFFDGSAPCGVELHYRAFAVSYGEEGYVVEAATNTDGVMRECDEPSDPPADPKAMWIEFGVTDAGVKLHWETCASDDFAVYKVVRSATNESPMYPLKDGDELLAAIGDPNQTWFLDENVEPGQTFTYRVLSMGEGPDGWVVLGLTEPITVTFE